VIIYENFTYKGELKFLSPEYEEIGKKLESSDLDAIIGLKLTEKYQKIIEFSFVNTGKSPVERVEMSFKECVTVTDKGLYWGKFETSFKLFTQHVKLK
jgi:hypothetical protein